MKHTLSTVALTIGLALTGQAAANGISCQAVYHGNLVYQQCAPERVTSWQAPVKTVSHTADTVYATDSDGKVLSSINHSGSASKHHSGYRSANSWGSKNTSTIIYTVTETKHD